MNPRLIPPSSFLLPPFLRYPTLTALPGNAFPQAQRRTHGRVHVWDTDQGKAWAGQKEALALRTEAEALLARQPGAK